KDLTLNGPAPASPGAALKFSPAAWIAVGEAIMPTSRAHGYWKPAQPCLSLNSMVSGPTTVALSRKVFMMPRDGDLDAGPSSRSRLNFTASASYGVPSVKVI